MSRKYQIIRDDMRDEMKHAKTDGDLAFAPFPMQVDQDFREYRHAKWTSRRDPSIDRLESCQELNMKAGSLLSDMIRLNDQIEGIKGEVKLDEVTPGTTARKLLDLKAAAHEAWAQEDADEARMKQIVDVGDVVCADVEEK